MTDLLYSEFENPKDIWIYISFAEKSRNLLQKQDQIKHDTSWIITHELRALITRGLCNAKMSHLLPHKAELE